MSVRRCNGSDPTVGLLCNSNLQQLSSLGNPPGMHWTTERLISILWLKSQSDQIGSNDEDHLYTIVVMSQVDFPGRNRQTFQADKLLSMFSGVYT